MKRFITLLWSLLILGLVSCAVVVPDTEDIDTGGTITSLEPKTPKSHDPIPLDEDDTDIEDVNTEDTDTEDSIPVKPPVVAPPDKITGSSTDIDKTTDLLSGVWKNSHGEIYYINITYAYTDGCKHNETRYSYDGITQYIGTNTTICFDDASYTSGYIYTKVEHTDPSLHSYSDIDKWYAIRFKDLSETRVMLFEACGAKSSTNTLEEAKVEFTVDNGYFDEHPWSIYKKLN